MTSKLGSSSSSSSSSSSRSSLEKSVLDMGAKNQSLWLVKVPREVAESWSQKQSDEVLGSLSINTVVAGPNAPPMKKISVKLASGGGIEGEEFTLEDLSSNDRQLLAFKLNEHSNSFAIQGQVTKSLVLRPKETKQYREKVRGRSIVATTRQEAQSVTEDDVELQRSVDRTVDFIPPAHAELKRKAQETTFANKMGRTTAIFDPTELRSKVFEAFAVNERYTLKELRVICKDVPGFSKEKDLKDCLDKYARYNMKGNFKGLWEIKMEFKDHAQQKPSATSSSSSSASSSSP